MTQTPKLHPDTVEEVKQRVDIVDIVSERVVLRKQGKDLVGLCPFHEEKTPSFTVSPSKQMYYCFGCGAGGNAITFLKELDKRSFSEIVLDLARRYQINVKTLAPQERQELQRQITLREQLLEILAIAASFYQHALRKPDEQGALDYLRINRQLTEDTIQQFQLGYAPPGWETLYSYLVEQKRYPVQLVEQAGLIVPRKQGNGYYDRFRDRLMIPICDIQGRVIGFGGRSLGDEQPKYLNSPETEVFDKGKTLFALDRAKEAITKQDKAIIVEGYFDAIALHASGISNVVASLGTALSVTQIRQLLRYTESKQIILNFDADQAGITATERAIGEIADLAYKGQIQLRILNIPDGKDADEFLKLSGTSQPYQDLIQKAPLWLEWQIHKIAEGKDFQQADQYLQTVGAIVRLLNKIEDSSSRTYYIQHSAQLLSQNDSRRISFIAEDLFKQLRKPQTHAAKNSNHSPQSNVAIQVKHPLLEKAEALLLQIYLHLPEHRNDIIKHFQELQAKNIELCLPYYRFFWSQIQSLEVPLDLPTDEFITKLQAAYLQFPELFKQVKHLVFLSEKAQADLERSHLIIQAAVACIERENYEGRARYALERIQEINPDTDPQGFKDYYQEFYNAKKRIAELDKQRWITLTDLL